MKRSTLVVLLFVAFVVYLLFRSRTTAAQALASTSAQPVGTAASTRRPTTAETVTGGILAGTSLLSSMLMSGSPSSVQIAQPSSTLQYTGSSDWSSLDVSPDFSTGAFSGAGSSGSRSSGVSYTSSPDYSSGAFSGAGLLV